MELLFILAIALLAGVISGIIGTGASIMLMPVFASVYGPKEAIPIMAVVSVMANVSRILVWWREVDWRAVAAYAGIGAPAAFLGARSMLALPPRAVDMIIGALLLAMIPGRRWLAARLIKLNLLHLAAAGGAIGFLTGIIASTGPASVPVFIGYGLIKGAFIGTEAAASLAIYATKTLTFHNSGALPVQAILRGLVVGGALMIGSFMAKPFVLRLAPERFRFIMDALLLVSGSSFLVAAM